MRADQAVMSLLIDASRNLNSASPLKCKVPVWSMTPAAVLGAPHVLVSANDCASFVPIGTNSCRESVLQRGMQGQAIDERLDVGRKRFHSAYQDLRYSQPLRHQDTRSHCHR